MNWGILLIGIGGFLGATARYVLSTLIGRTFSTAFPYGTLTVNLIGSFALGRILGEASSESVVHFAVVGFLGAFTTFSTISWESITLWRERRRLMLFVYLAATYLLGFAFAYLGLTL
jgi:CrcB protein